MQCRGRRSSRGVGPDTSLVISHAHRIAINEQEKGSGAGRRCAGAGTKVAKGSFVEVWEVGSGFCWTTARASRERSCSATRGCATRSPTPACWGSRCGMALRRRQPAFFGEAPLRRRVAGHERGAGLRVQSRVWRRSFAWVLVRW